ncbi:putative membrane protein YsxD [Pullulanibacillus camelliae]|uniref:Putative membrane protein YsxD n=1 Tax=Pullulanibacillus camelliae TaxID=1707096 RepID=A0A8J2VYR0_9BACL|nr:DUF5668 domain-containing protein [Pullulanibacillus camelliae]GGE42540.1 putative membrane protein YsxD [Pullulanibacillus camelliae]
MKKQNVFIGIIIVAIGGYFLLRTLHLPYLTAFNNWPTFLMLIGLAFILYSYFSKDTDSIFIGVLLFGLGIHYHFYKRFVWWPNGWAAYGLIISFAFLAQYYKTRKKGLKAGLFFLVLSILDLFYSGVQAFTYHITAWVGNLWPIALILLGLYLIFRKK